MTESVLPEQIHFGVCVYVGDANNATPAAIFSPEEFILALAENLKIPESDVRIGMGLIEKRVRLELRRR